MRGRKFLTPEYDGSLTAGQDLVVAGFIGISGTLAIMKSQEERLAARFSAGYLSACRDLQALLVDEDVLLRYQERNCTFISQLAEEGIMAGLWHMAEFFQKGLAVDLQEIPVRQETVEITEVFDINPYRLQSAGSFLLAANHGGDLVALLKKVEIPAKVIGKVEAGISRRIYHGDIVTYLDRPGKDELTKIL